MPIGRSDDPQNPCRVAASKVTVPFGSGSRNPSGPAAACRNIQAGHTTATAPDRIFSFTPCTNRAVHTRPTPILVPPTVIRDIRRIGARPRITLGRPRPISSLIPFFLPIRPPIGLVPDPTSIACPTIDNAAGSDTLDNRCGPMRCRRRIARRKRSPALPIAEPEGALCRAAQARSIKLPGGVGGAMPRGIPLSRSTALWRPWRLGSRP